MSNLTADELEVLAALMRADGPTTVEHLDTVLERDGLTGREISTALRQLEAREPPLTAREVDAGLGVEVWIATEAAIAAVEDESGP